MFLINMHNEKRSFQEKRNENFDTAQKLCIKLRL